MVVASHIEEIRSVYTEWKEAVMARKVSTLNLLYAEDFIFSGCGGSDRNKNDVLCQCMNQSLEYLTWEENNTEIEIGENVATLRAIQVIKMFIYELPVNLERLLEIKFTKVDNHWAINHIIETKLG